MRLAPALLLLAASGCLRASQVEPRSLDERRRLAECRARLTGRDNGRSCWDAYWQSLAELEAASSCASDAECEVVSFSTSAGGLFHAANRAWWVSAAGDRAQLRVSRGCGFEDGVFVGGAPTAVCRAGRCHLRPGRFEAVEVPRPFVCPDKAPATTRGPAVPVPGLPARR